MGLKTCPHCGAVRVDNPFMPRQPVKATILELIQENPGRYSALQLADLVPPCAGDEIRSPEGVRIHIAEMRKRLKTLGLDIISSRQDGMLSGYQLVRLENVAAE